MRIIILIDRYFPILGGAQNNVHEMAQRLSSMGFSVTVLTRKIYASTMDVEVVNCITIRRFGYFPFRIVSKVLFFFRSILYLIHYRRDYDVVLSVPCVEFTDLLPAYLASIITKIPYIIRMTGFPTFFDRELFKCKSWGITVRNILIPVLIRRSIFDRASAVIAQSKVLLGIINENTAARCVIIRNGVDTDCFRFASGEEKLEIRKQLGLPEDNIIVINTGRYDFEKNQITLINAAERIEHDLRSGKIYVLILGATHRNQVTSNEEEIKKYVQKRGLSYFIQFVDDAVNVEEYLRASDIFVHPTTNEGMSNALIEAMACGLPTVCSDIPQETCMFPNGEGRFFSPFDIVALTGHLTTLIDSEELRKSEGLSLAQFARKHYSNDCLVTQYADLFHKVVHMAEQ